MAIININTEKIPIRFHQGLEKVDTNAWLKYNESDVYLQLSIPNAHQSYLVEVFSSNDVIISNIQVLTVVYSTDRGNCLLIRLRSVLYSGECYVKISEGQFFSRRSDPFCFVIGKLNKITFWSNCGLVGNLIYPEGPNVRNSISLSNDVVVLLGDNTLEVESVEDGFGEETAVQQKLIQKYTFSEFVPNHIAEACTLIPFHDNMELEIDSKKYNIKNLEVELESDQLGYNATVIFSFEIERFIETICCNPISEIWVLPPALFRTTVVSYSQITIGWNGSNAGLGVKGHWFGHRRKSQGNWSNTFRAQINNNNVSYANDFTGLVPNTLYEFRIRTEDYRGNLSRWIYVEARTFLRIII